MQAERKISFYRALILGALLIPINLYWLMHAESLKPAVYSTLFTLFYNVTFSIFVLVILNALLKRAVPQLAFQPSEILIVYVMLSIGTGIFGHDLMIVVVPTLTSMWAATPENEWAVLFGRHIPQWLTVYDESALIAFQKGETTLYADRNLSAWLLPVAFWSGFLVVLLFVLLCMNAIIRKQWTENEKLSYPVIQLPLELARGGTGLLSNRALWIGFILTGSIDVINGLHGLFPVVPSFKIVYNPAPLFAAKPWNAIGWTPVAVYPFVIGLVYFLPVNLSFSAWFFSSVLEVGTHLPAGGRNLAYAGTVSKLSDIWRVDSAYHSRFMVKPQIPQASIGLGYSRRPAGRSRGERANALPDCAGWDGGGHLCLGAGVVLHRYVGSDCRPFSSHLFSLHDRACPYPRRDGTAGARRRVDRSRATHS